MNSGTLKPRYRPPSDPTCKHPGLTRRVVEGAGFVSRDAAAYECPDCGYVNTGDVGSRFDIEQARR